MQRGAQVAATQRCNVRATSWDPKLKANSVPLKAQRFPQHSIRENCSHTRKRREQDAYQPATSHHLKVIPVSLTSNFLPLNYFGVNPKHYIILSLNINL